MSTKIEGAMQDLPPIGAELLTSDDTYLGVVSEVVGRSFKVSAPMERDYWLPLGTVALVNGRRVRLSFSKGELNVLKKDHPLAA